MEKLLRAVEKICKLLEGKEVKWMVVGSTSLALQGVEVEPKDIDILTTKEGAHKISSIFEKYGVEPAKFRKSRIFSPHFGKFEIDGIDVEIFGDLKAKIEGEWVSLSWGLNRPNFVKIKNLKVPVSRLEDELKVCSEIKREKDLEFLKSKNLN